VRLMIKNPVKGKHRIGKGIPITNRSAICQIDNNTH
jgi:hypothetical protein